jgi:hypothetical protein
VGEMDKKLIVSLCIVSYIVAGFFWCNPWTISAILGNEVPVEMPEILADNSDNNEQENSSWNGHYALIRLEDVHPLRDLATLTGCIELLQSKDIPFSIALIPIYKNPEENVTVCLRERPELVQIIKDSGATVVLHGSTHQWDGETGEDFEFWDEILDQPIPQNNTEYAISKVERALEELEECNLSAEIWETPYYKSTYEAAQVVSWYFTKTYERTGDKLVINEFGQIVIPTNLYYVTEKEPIISVFEILKNAENISKNNDNDTVASFYYHTFFGSDYLRTIIGGLKKQGYRFIGPEEYILSVDMENVETMPQYSKVME